MLLTDEERERFAQYCVQCAESSRKITKQLEMLTIPAKEELIKRENLKEMAYCIVANELNSGETEQIG